MSRKPSKLMNSLTRHAELPANESDLIRDDKQADLADDWNDPAATTTPTPGLREAVDLATATSPSGVSQPDWFVTRWLFLLGGLLCLTLATAGAFLPVLPCTPFVLLAVYCFARSSTRLHNWLLNSRLFGGIIRDWQQHRAIRRRVRSSSVVLILVVVVLTLWIVKPSLLVAVAILSLVGIGLAVIFRLPVCD